MLNAIDQNKIETVLKAYTGKDKLNLTPLLAQWAENKKDIFDLFNGSLTIEKQFSGTLTDDDIMSRFSDFRGENDYFSYRVDDFMDELTAEEIKNNKCIEDREVEEYPNYIKGQKITKYIISMIDDRPNFTEINGKSKSKSEYFAIQFSMFLQSLKFDGIIVSSIDPLDYLTMSLNKNNWQSCHGPEGCYQAGMLSYMTDSCSVINYVKSIKDSEYKVNGIEFTHNSKKWRQVGYIDINTLSSIFSRQYPSDNETAARTARELIGDQYSKFIGIENKYTITRNSRRIRAMVKDLANNPLHYNDVLSAEREYTRLKMSEGGENPNIIIGNTPYCPVCGDTTLKNSGTLVCKRCIEGSYICPDCGETVYPGENNCYYIDGYYYCESCLNKNFTRCEHCGDYERRENMVMLNGIYVCNRCLDRRYTRCSDCGTYVKNDLFIEHQGNRYCVTCYDRIAIEEEVSA